MKKTFDIEKDLLHPTENNIEMLFNKTHFLQQALKNKNGINPKFTAHDFYYKEDIQTSHIPNQGKSSAEVLESLCEMFEGSIRPHSPYALFNMVPSPLLDTIAASTMTQLYNTNSIMDDFGGKTLLFEQRIARALGHLIGWKQSHGISCNGGKLTLLYAIKSAISRIAPQSKTEGIPNDLVILTNEGAHFSIEHVCSFLGLGANQCVRIRSKADWRMDTVHLKQVIQEQIAQGKRIAAVICCGGTTINFVCDDTLEVYQCVEQIFKDTAQTYFPYFHLDSVIGWLWFNLMGLSESEWKQKVTNDHIRFKMKRVLEKLKGVSMFDSFGVDMHKNALCPYATSFFISKTDTCFNDLNQGSYEYGENDYKFGQFRTYRYTIENSRPSTGIASAWIAVNRLGKVGFQEYLVRLHTLSLAFEKNLNMLPGVSVINHLSLGWELIFTITFSQILSVMPDQNVVKIANTFIQYCWKKNNQGYETPFISIVPEYRITPEDAGQVAFLLYPMSLFAEEMTEEIIRKLEACITEFEKKVIAGEISIENCILEKPIR
ncbi:pyridoxal-dependent decarboxylase [Bacillus tropicus]|uniref:pyridoxal phosphate-dependent decarboxylase family protein n=1 Tax=Bacillus tropicus TaxID=2026188 RepID=UPI003D1FE737